PDHPDSNYRMALETLLSKVPVPPGNVRRIPAESPDAAAAASAYESTLKSYFGLKEGQAPRFDLILLGLGADGHVASLFPGSEALREPRRLVTAPWVEPVRARRITLTPPVIRNAASVMVLVSGDANAEALRRDLEFYRIADRYLDDSLHAYPTQATLAGYHKYDSILEDLTTAGIGEKLRLATNYQAELRAVEPERLSTSARIDYHLVRTD